MIAVDDITCEIAPWLPKARTTPKCVGAHPSDQRRYQVRYRGEHLRLGNCPNRPLGNFAIGGRGYYRFPRLLCYRDPVKGSSGERSLQCKGLAADAPMQEVKIAKAFIESCANGRIKNLCAAVKVIVAAGPGARVAESIYAMIIPGSGLIQGLDVIFKCVGFDWREVGRSLRLGMNPDQLEPDERCPSASDCSFEGRQGTGGRILLVSPAMAAAAAAVTGELTNVCRFLSPEVTAGPKLKLISALEFFGDPVFPPRRPRNSSTLRRRRKLFHPSMHSRACRSSSSRQVHRLPSARRER